MCACIGAAPPCIAALGVRQAARRHTSLAPSAPSAARRTPLGAPLRLRAAQRPCRVPAPPRAAASAAAAATSAASAAAATVAAASAPLNPFIEASFGVATVYTLLLYAAMLRGRPARPRLRSLWLFSPLALLYAVLLALSWAPDTLSLMLPGSLEEGLRTGQPQFFPRLGGIMQLLSRRATAASAWVHLLTINAFAARWVYLDGLRRRLPVAHSLALSLLAGPLGLASHLLTRRVAALVRAALRRRRSR